MPGLRDKDMTEQELLKLDLWVAEVAGINTWDTGTVRDFQMAYCDKGTGRTCLWHPHASFDQAVEYLGPVLERKNIDVVLFLQVGVTPLVEMHADDPIGDVGVEHKRLSTAFCLAARAALEKDDENN